MGGATRNNEEGVRVKSVGRDLAYWMAFNQLWKKKEKSFRQ